MNTRTCLVFALALAVAAQAADPILLTRRQKVGDELLMALSVTIKDPSGDAKLMGSVREKVIGIDKAGVYTLEQRLDQVKVQMGDQMISVDDVSISTYILQPSGELVGFSRDRAKPQDLRLALMTLGILPSEPIAERAAWKRSFQADPASGSRAIEYDMRLVGSESIGGAPAWKVSVAAKEVEGAEPMQSTGWLWVRPTDGAVIKRQFSIKNAPLGAGGKLLPVEWRLELAH